MKDLMSQVELKKDLVKVGMELFYCDIENYMSYLVVSVDENSFECVDLETKEIELYFFNELQRGWEFKDNDFNRLIAKVF
jgi:hypothetical protein